MQAPVMLHQADNDHDAPQPPRPAHLPPAHPAPAVPVHFVHVDQVFRFWLDEYTILEILGSQTLLDLAAVLTKVKGHDLFARPWHLTLSPGNAASSPQFVIPSQPAGVSVHGPYQIQSFHADQTFVGNLPLLLGGGLSFLFDYQFRYQYNLLLEAITDAPTLIDRTQFPIIARWVASRWTLDEAMPHFAAILSRHGELLLGKGCASSPQIAFSVKSDYYGTITARRHFDDLNELLWTVQEKVTAAVDRGDYTTIKIAVHSDVDRAQDEVSLDEWPRERAQYLAQFDFGRSFPALTAWVLPKVRCHWIRVAHGVITLGKGKHGTTACKVLFELLMRGSGRSWHDAFQELDRFCQTNTTRTRRRQ
ncbi:hypothetical protein GGF32_009780 [Allomyces javanicus]|nr:hypothetical protein GGF32_009780 [Allomyces javanicus]